MKMDAEAGWEGERMSVKESPAVAGEIGEAAGVAWRALEKKGPMSLGKLREECGLSAARANQALGWLAREDKIAFETDERGHGRFRLNGEWADPGEGSGAAGATPCRLARTPPVSPRSPRRDPRSN